MAKNYRAEGRRSINYVNTTGAAIASGDVVAMGEILGVALVDIPIAGEGAVGFGVFDVAKADAADITQGQSVLWDSSAGDFDDNAAIPASGDIGGAACVAWETKGVTTGETIEVMFTGVPGTLTP